MRGQAQGFLVMVRSGIGLLIGAQASGWLFNNLLNANAMELDAWRLFWALPAGMALAVLVGFWFFFNENEKS